MIYRPHPPIVQQTAPWPWPTTLHLQTILDVEVRNQTPFISPHNKKKREKERREEGRTRLAGFPFTTPWRSSALARMTDCIHILPRTLLSAPIDFGTHRRQRQQQHTQCVPHNNNTTTTNTHAHTQEAGGGSGPLPHDITEVGKSHTSYIVSFTACTPSILYVCMYVCMYVYHGRTWEHGGGGGGCLSDEGRGALSLQPDAPAHDSRGGRAN
jgi:hypothetical protein